MTFLRYGLLGLALVAGAQQPGGINFYSVDKEIELGKVLAKDMDSRTSPLNSPIANTYVDRVTQELASRIPDSKFPYSVTLVRDDLGSEAVVLAGGHIYLSAGLFTAAQSEAELVGLLAHAMALVADRAATRMATRTKIAEMATAPIQGMWGLSRSNDTSQSLVTLQRKDAMAADAQAVKAMAAADYDPADYARYVERTGKDDDTLGWDDFQKNRLANLRQAAAGVSMAPGGDGSDFARVRDALVK